MDGGTHAAVLTIDVREQDVADYEWIEEGKPYREWCIPAKELVKYRATANSICGA